VPLNNENSSVPESNGVHHEAGRAMKEL